MPSKLKKLSHFAYLSCPIITMSLSITLGFVTMHIENTVSPLFIFISVQFYLNWYLIFRVCRKIPILFTKNNCGKSMNDGQTLYWYCARCKHYSKQPAQHCSLCKKCYYYRDHHCYFLGCCVIRQNIGNFILLCIYASFACIYSSAVIGHYLYEYFIVSHTSKLNVYYFFLNFFFPITFAKYLLINDESVHVFLVTLFNITISISIFTMSYGLWKIYTCLVGKQKYYPDEGKQHDTYEIFGSYGWLNFIFPFNGFLQSRSINEKYELKKV